MLDFVTWYVIVFSVGWLAFPLIYRLLSDLPGRGLAFSKIFGLLFWGYSFWILGRLGFTANNLAGLFFSLLLIAAASFWVVREHGFRPIREWLIENWRLIVTVELLFLLSFLAMAIVRGYNPEIVGTEKPMELAFINAILGSENMPPRDPWLSGFAISYYYFGFLIVGMLAKLAGTLGSVAFNLAVALTFALGALGSYGVLYNLLSLRSEENKSALLPALLAPFFTFIVSNWEGFLHYLHSLGFLWSRNVESGNSPFWSWLDIQDLVDPPLGDSFGHWWWWRASRVIQDYDFSGFGKEVISEFPFFSFLLGDLHPHVLSIPYVFLILGFGLALYLRPRGKSFKWLGILRLEISTGYFLILAWLVGSMAFLNTWNFPMYVGILAGAYALRGQRERPDANLGLILKDFLYIGVALGITGVILYLPWYLGFSSQAGGILPNVLYVTRGSQFWVMFGPLLLPILIWLVVKWREHKTVRNARVGLIITTGLILGLLIWMLSYVGLASILDLTTSQGNLVQLFLGLVGGTDLSQVVMEGLIRRIRTPGTWLTLGLVGFFGWSLLFPHRQLKEVSSPQRKSREVNFVLLLILSGMALVLFPEFIYLRDLFGYRINTIFKFYYQAWLIWSIAAAYVMAVLAMSLKGTGRILIIGVLLISVGMGLFYPVLSLQSKTNNFSRQGGLTLDGTYLYPQSDYQGVEYLREAGFGVIAEAVGGSYSTAHARMATYTGFQTILGWDFHEVQWRGGWDLVTPRKQDVAAIYCESQWEPTRYLLEQYRVRYLVVGDTEYSTYQEGSENCAFGISVEKFNQNLDPVFQNEQLIIYSVPDFQKK